MAALEPPWPAPAKVNRMLRIVGRRPDGYHLLQTVFQFLDHCDWLRFEPRDDKLITRAVELPGVPPETDLSLRAARLLAASAGIERGVNLHLDKRLPMGGGLGGGSSDAATTLVALNHQWSTGFSEDQLAALGLELGADVPVFVRGRAAWAEGVGEKLIPIELDTPWFAVLIPPGGVDTREIFQDPSLTRNSQPINIADFIAGDAANDCEALVYSRHPSVAAAASYLAQFGPARLTGTGGCVFAIFASRQAALAALADPPCPGFVARGLNESPLLARLTSP
ncbi:MAG: 4-(cytidine 5'-diphospho)-2-C-methyl-D-erythritol kinase [Candidatus Competibacteraceae bacterium]|nr:4-(cytidine 5'-diphospho)-2-C-methyl-D-erythritol kinase [Candidatus Competibacteraceae bacterium]